MAHGIIHGAKHGAVHGDKHNQLLFGGIAATKDGTSGIFVPANSTEWNAILVAASIASGGPSSLWLCQEASGNPADSIGSVTLTAAGTGLSYQGVVSGWSRLALGTTDGGTGNFRGSTGPSTASNSILILTYGIINTTPGTTRTIMGYGNNLEQRILLTTGFNRTIDGVNTADGATLLTGSVRPYVYRYNKTGSTATGFTNIEKLVPTFGSQSSTAPSLGAGGGSSPAANYLYAALFSGAAAELTDGQVKTLLQTLGWTISWS